jgi:hypothetical protein
VTPEAAVPRFVVNCSMLFTELPMLQRPQAARDAGFRAIEFWWPFTAAVPADTEVDAFVRAVTEAGVRLTGLNFAGGDMTAGQHAVRRIHSGRNRMGTADLTRRTDSSARPTSSVQSHIGEHGITAEAVDGIRSQSCVQKPHWPVGSVPRWSMSHFAISERSAVPSLSCPDSGSAASATAIFPFGVVITPNCRTI